MANASAIRQHAAHTTDYHQLAAKQKPYQQACLYQGAPTLEQTYPNVSDISFIE